MFGGMRRGFLNGPPPANPPPATPSTSGPSDAEVNDTTRFPPMPRMRLVEDLDPRCFTAFAPLQPDPDPESSSGEDEFMQFTPHWLGQEEPEFPVDPDYDPFDSDPNWLNQANLPPPHPPPPPGEKPIWMPLLAKEGMSHGMWSRAYCEIEQARRMRNNTESLLFVHYKGPVIVNQFTGEERQLPSRTLMVPPESITNLCDPAFDYEFRYPEDGEYNL